jgi:Protein kinase domain/PEGA domain
LGHLPPTIGRYEVIGPLASGGMAEIVLARMVGPNGFYRPFVVKRILPHLAQSEAFVSMFLDEARIVAGLHHPNVVTVQELGRHEGELFMVFEHLEGESVGGLARRLVLENEVLDPRLCAYIAAEACAGLHAAHELADADGVTLDIVHRDVSPQNVFLTYDGHVKVLDFGIATARGRLARTDAGAFKGKWAYMAPEQCRGESVDRRTDIFAIGAVLYELSTNRRLFFRNGELATLRAILDEPIVAPSRLTEGYPRALERICLRALSRDPNDRYATAAEMRADLLLAVQELGQGAPADPAADLARRMRELYADRIEQKRDTMRMLRDGASVARVPPGDVDEGVEISVATAARPAAADDQPLEMAVTKAHEPPARPRRRVWLAAAGALAIGAGAFATRALWTRAHASSGSPAAVEAGAVNVRVVSSPPGATIAVDGRPQGETPLDVRLPRRSDPVTIDIARAGFRASAHRIVPSQDQTLVVALEGEEPAKPAAPEVSSAAHPSRGARPHAPARAPSAKPTAAPPPTASAPFFRFD